MRDSDDSFGRDIKHFIFGNFTLIFLYGKNKEQTCIICLFFFIRVDNYNNDTLYELEMWS